MCPSRTTCLSMDCCISELSLYNPDKRFGLVQSGPHHHFNENKFFRAMIYLKNCWLGVKQQSHTNTHLYIGLVSIKNILLVRTA